METNEDTRTSSEESVPVEKMVPISTPTEERYE